MKKQLVEFGYHYLKGALPIHRFTSKSQGAIDSWVEFEHETTLDDCYNLAELLQYGRPS